MDICVCVVSTGNVQVARHHILCHSLQVIDCFVLHLNDWDKVCVEEPDHTPTRPSGQTNYTPLLSVGKHKGFLTCTMSDLPTELLIGPALSRRPFAPLARKGLGRPFGNAGPEKEIKSECCSQLDPVLACSGVN